MKATGIVRRVDDLGRVVIPMELRKTININEKDPLEIFTDGNSIILKPYGREIERAEMVRQLSKVKALTKHSAIEEIVDNAIDYIKKA